MQKFVFLCLQSSFKPAESIDVHKGKEEEEAVDVMKAYGVVEVHFLSFLTSGLGVGSGQIHAPVTLSWRNSSW